jgi:hypothetical protein
MQFSGLQELPVSSGFKEILWSLPCKYFEVFYKMSLVKLARCICGIGKIIGLRILIDQIP